MASKFSGLLSFMEMFVDAIERDMNGRAIIQAFEVGDDVHYEGSKVADHGHWVVKAVDDETNTVTIGRFGSGRMLKCNQTSVRHTVAPETSLY